MRTLRLNRADRVRILGVELDNVSLDSAVRLITDHISTGSELATVFTPNADIVDRCHSDKTGELLRLYNSASLSVPDGIGVVKASRLLKTPLKERVAGIELAERLLLSAAKINVPVYFLGGGDGIANVAAENMCMQISNLSVSGVHHGFFDKHGFESDAVVKNISESGAKLLFVCFGAPTQEKWIAENADALSETGILCAVGLGGSFDVWSGEVKRAPRIVRSIGLEWLYRSLSNPKRIGRIFSVLRFSVAVFAERLRFRKHRQSKQP